MATSIYVLGRTSVRPWQLLTTESKRMAEPISTTTAGVASGSLGLLALLIGWFGPAGAEVAMVAVSAASGSVFALGGIENKDGLHAVKFVISAVMFSLAASWGLAKFAIWYFGDVVDGPYLPSTVALVIGMGFDKWPHLIKWALRLAKEFLTKKFGVSNDNT